MLKRFLILTFPTLVFASVSNGPYIGVEAGVSNQIVLLNSGTAVNTTTTNGYNSSVDFATRLNLGYNLNQYSGFELSGNYDFGGTINTPTNVSFPSNSTAVDLSYILNFPTTFRSFSIFGRVGVAYDWINSNNSCNCNAGNSISGQNLTDVLGAGVKYSLTTKTALRLEWIENGLLFPLALTSGSENVADWSNQTFLLGINLSY